MNDICVSNADMCFVFCQHPDPELLGLDEEVSFSAGRPLLSPLISPGDPSMDLEQQWQDLLAIMEPQVSPRLRRFLSTFSPIHTQ